MEKMFSTWLNLALVLKQLLDSKLLDEIGKILYCILCLSDAEMIFFLKQLNISAVAVWIIYLGICWVGEGFFFLIFDPL